MVCSSPAVYPSLRAESLAPGCRSQQPLMQPLGYMHHPAPLGSLQHQIPPMAPGHPPQLAPGNPLDAKPQVTEGQPAVQQPMHAAAVDVAQAAGRQGHDQAHARDHAGAHARGEPRPDPRQRSAPRSPRLPPLEPMRSGRIWRRQRRQREQHQHQLVDRLVRRLAGR